MYIRGSKTNLCTDLKRTPVPLLFHPIIQPANRSAAVQCIKSHQDLQLMFIVNVKIGKNAISVTMTVAGLLMPDGPI